MKSYRMLFVVDELLPVRAAPSVRVHALAKGWNRGVVELFGGRTGTDQLEDDSAIETTCISRPDEQKPLSFAVFIVVFSLGLIKRCTGGRYDVIVVSIPKYELLPALLLASYLSKSRLVLDVRDSPDFLNYQAYLEHFLPSFLAKALGQFMNGANRLLFRVALRRVDLITVANKAIGQVIRDLGYEPFTVENGVDTDLFKSEDLARHSRCSKPLSLVYVGNFAEKDCFEWIVQELQGMAEKVILHLVGSGRNKQRVLGALQKAGASVVDHGNISHDELPKVLDTMDAGVLFRQEDVNESIPVSIYEFASLGLPVICNPVGVMGEFVRQYQLGYLVSSPSEFTEVLKLLVDGNPGLDPERLRETAQGNFSRSKQTAYFYNCIDTVLGLSQ